jgi:hypothetical protein
MRSIAGSLLSFVEYCDAEPCTRAAPELPRTARSTARHKVLELKPGGSKEVAEGATLRV